MIKGLGVNRLGQNNFRQIGRIDFSYKNILKPQFFGITYFSQLNQKYLPIITAESYNINRVFIELRRKEGGLKKIWWYSQDSDNPIESAQFELTQKGSGGCQIKFAYLDIPIEAQDYVNIIVAGDHLYKGFVENDVDISYPVLTAKGYNQRLNETLYSYDYVLATDPITIIEDIITAISSKTGITFRSDLIDLGVMDPIIIEYVDETAGKIIDDLVSRASNRFWGVNTENEFYISAYNTGAVDQYFYNFDGSIYESADFKKDYSKIKATQYNVYRKNDSTGKTDNVGSVGNVGNAVYPELDIIYKLRIIENKITASELVQPQTALEWAYLKLQNEVDLKTQIAIKGIDINSYRPVINDRILAEDEFKSAFLVINDCQSVSDFTNARLTITGGLDNEDCVTLFYDPATESILNIGESKEWFKQEKIGFYMKGTLGKKVKVRFSNDLISFTDYTISLRSTGDYEYYSFDFSSAFRYIQFENIDLTSWTCCVYKIQVLCYDKRQYTESVVNVKYQFDSISIKCDIQAGALDEQESDKLFNLEKKIRILETINAI